MLKPQGCGNITGNVVLKILFETLFPPSKNSSWKQLCDFEGTSHACLSCSHHGHRVQSIGSIQVGIIIFDF